MKIPFYLLLLLLLPLAARADSLSFADSLAEEQDLYRAITEYKRFLHESPDDLRAPYARLAIARSLLAGERWTEADLALERVWTDAPQSGEALTARKLYAEAAFRRGDYELAEERYRQLKAFHQEPDIDYRIGLSALYQNRVGEARDNFAQLPDPLGEPLLLSLEDFQRLERKSPALAGTLSALLPGAGQLYTERPRQAGIAFALNAAFIYGAVEAWDNEDYAVAGILSLFELGWYGGNIYNAMNNAHKFNRRREQLFLDRFRQRFGFHFGLQQEQVGLQALFRF